MVVLMGMCLLIGAGLANADFILYQNNYDSGTAGQSISVEGWTNAAKILYSSGKAYRSAPAGDTEQLESYLAFSHTLAAGETVTLQTDVIGVGNADVGFGLRTASGNSYQVRSRISGKACISMKNYNTVGITVLPSWVSTLSGTLITYRIHLSQNMVSFEYALYGAGSWVGWAPLGSMEIDETAITAIKLNHGFPDGSNNWGSNFQWDNMTLTSLVTATAAPVFSPGGKYISGPTPITITSATDGAVIYYTTDGAIPTTSSAVYTQPVVVKNGDVLKAIAVGSDTSFVTRLNYEVPSSYNRPTQIPLGSVTVDGDLKDWANATWAPINLPYDQTASDISEAYYAAKWQANKVYVAVKVRDTAHYFTNNYTDWYLRDAVELYLHTDNNGPDNYPNCEVAQQYTVGIKASDPTKVWAALGNGFMYPNMFAIPEDGSLDNIFKAKGSVDGEWLYYEIEVTPFTYLGLVTGGENVATTLHLSDVIGLDVCAVGNNNGLYTGMKSECGKGSKTGSWTAFGLHELANEEPFLVMQWGPMTPNGIGGNTYYLNNNIIDGHLLGVTLNSGLWEIDKTGTALHTLVNTSTAKSVVKVGSYLYYSSTDSTSIYRTLADTWEAPGTVVSVSNSLPIVSLATDGTYIYASTAKATNGQNQVYKYSVDSATGALTLVWETIGIEATGVRGLSYHSSGYVYAVSGGRNSTTGTSNTAHLYAIKALDGAVTDLGAITHMGETYQVVRVDSQLWVADALTVTGAYDGKIYMYDLAGSTTLASTTPTIVCNPNNIQVIFGLAVDGDFVWMTGNNSGVAGQVYGYTFYRPISGDANKDRAVDVGDLGILAANYGTTSGATWAKGDFNCDGAVDVGDLGILAANYGTGSSGSNFNADYAKAFGTTVADDTVEQDTSSSVCSGLGLPLIAGLLLAGLMLVKLEE
jgi:hypothetical protein